MIHQSMFDRLYARLYHMTLTIWWLDVLALIAVAVGIALFVYRFNCFSFMYWPRLVEIGGACR